MKYPVIFVSKQTSTFIVTKYFQKRLILILHNYLPLISALILAQCHELYYICCITTFRLKH